MFDLSGKIVDTVGTLAEALVPWKIVAPPIAFKDLPKLYALVDDLRKAGAIYDAQRDSLELQMIAMAKK